MTSRYIANNTAAHIQANQNLADKIMSLIQSPAPGNPKKSAGIECKTDAKEVAKGWEYWIFRQQKPDRD